MQGGTISGNTATHGGGVRIGNYVGSSISTFTKQGGEISGNIASSGGGGVESSGSTFIMQGGIISGNTTNGNHGGGVNLVSGTFTMYGGIIYGSNAFPIALRNNANISAALFRGSGSARYGDGSNILPHTDGVNLRTENTIRGRR
jgi:hypothetical protein